MTVPYNGTSLYCSLLLYRIIYDLLRITIFSDSCFHSPKNFVSNEIMSEHHLRSDKNFMMASSTGKIFRVTGHLCREFTGHRWIPCTKASDVELWYLLWSLCMKPISFQSKASVVCSVTAAVFIDFCLKKLNVFSQHIGKKTYEYLNSTEQIPRNWNVDHLSMLITS